MRCTPRRFLGRHFSFEQLEPRLAMAAFYVATNGNDSANGSLATPFLTLGRAVSAVNAGDEIVMRAGTYAGGITIDDNNVTIRSYQGESVIVTAPINNSSIFQTIWFNASGGRIQGLEVIGGYYYALKFERGNAVVEDSILHGSGRDVVKIVPNANNITIRRCEIYDSGLRDASNAEGI